MSESERGAAPPATKVLAAFAAVYIIWGSTYLAILYAIETMPPFLMAGVRFLAAGLVLYGWARLRGASRPAGEHWIAATVIGGFLLLGGNGAVTWAEQRVASGPAALLVATLPLWMVLVEWLRPGGTRPTGRTIVGLVLGFGGLALLVGPGELGGGAIDPVGALVLAMGSLAWAIGSIYSRGAPKPSSPQLMIGMQMLAGGALLVVAGLVAGETAAVELSAISVRSTLALLYLIVFGSLIGYSAYIFLLGATTPARVSTYAYVNPVVAVLLGWAFAGEPLTLRVILASVVIIGAVAVITVTKGRGAGASEQEREEREAPRRSARPPARRTA